jgi:lysosomal alpha-glucosidase
MNIIFHDFLGSFNPFFRNHNGITYIDQDPASFSPAATASNRRAVELRYTLIPFLYTLFHRVHISGGTVVRSMAHVFPTDANCWSLDEQFLWGSSLLIAPVIYEDHVNKSLYLPTTERWFNYYTGEEQKTLGEITVSAPMDFVPLYIRGGSILPHQESAMNTMISRQKPMYLIVALDKNERADGNLFWDDGDSIDTYENSMYNYFSFNYKAKRLNIEPWTYKYQQMTDEVHLDSIRIFGINNEPTRIICDGQSLTVNNQWTFNSTSNTLHLKMLRLNMAKSHRIILLDNM